MATVTQERDRIFRRMQRIAEMGNDKDWEECLYARVVAQRQDGSPVVAKQPRWRLSQHWVEFECGCVAERCEIVHARMVPGDAVIFVGLPEQAVYEEVCDRHLPAMNKRCGLVEWNMDWHQWYERRRHVLMRRAK